MPELAEVEYYKNQWKPGLEKQVISLHMNPSARIFRNTDTQALHSVITGASLGSCQAHGKQMLFGFSPAGWLGVHLGMTGKLSVQQPDYSPKKHDHLILFQKSGALVFSDPRQFGLIRFSPGHATPEWWNCLPPSLLNEEFSLTALTGYLRRKQKSPIKAVLLMQDRFPGIGNWMADEILWQARIKPHCPAGLIAGSEDKSRALFQTIKEVCTVSLGIIGNNWGDPPSSWLFSHRWQDGGYCPQTGKKLIREKVGGRTTCWSPHWQRWP